jgi:hypothetical protein
MSPIDESGYLVPVVNFSNSQMSNTSSSIIGGNGSSKFGQKSNSNNLTRSFSTRSAYTASSTQGASGLLGMGNKINRVTICEQSMMDRFEEFGGEYCIRCNAKLDSNNSNSKLKSVNYYNARQIKM